MANAQPVRSLADRVDIKLSGSRLRVLIIGGGVAGSTLAALLTRMGEPAAVIERAQEGEDEGYSLGLLPLGGRVLNALRLRDSYASNSSAMTSYELYDRHGKKARSYPLSSIVDAYGDWRGISRQNLVSLLRSAQDGIIYEARVTDLVEIDEGVRARFHDGSETSVDVVVAAEGVHSPTRKALWPEEDVETFDTGWGGYVFWAEDAGLPLDTYSELWSAGWGIGLYPVNDRLSLFVGGPRDYVNSVPLQDFMSEIRAKVPDGSCFAQALDQTKPGETPFFWPMTDIRTKSAWSRGRVVLLGDACASYLPTAGIGASQAMDSAAALADELSRADHHLIPYALRLFEKRQRHRVELTQDNSRKLARLMFMDSKALTMVRDWGMQFYNLKSLVHEISQIIEGD